MELPVYFMLLLLLLLSFLLVQTKKRTTKRLPPGSMGLPIIGQSLSLLKAMKANKGEQWFQQRIKKYGPISKLSLFGTPTVFLHGQAANKFIYTCDGNTLANKQPPSISRIIGEKNLLELTGDDHRRVRGALVSFLKPEVLKQYIRKIDEEIRNHLEMYWHGKQEVKVMPLMKTLTFNVISSLLFGMEQGKKREILLELFQDVIGGVLSVPVNLPFTRFNRSLRSSAKIKAMVMDLINQKRKALEEHTDFPHQDLITSMLSVRNQEDNSNTISDKEILDNTINVMIAGHDTTSILLTFLVRLLANNPSVHSAIVQEQEEIARSKASGEILTWDDISKMKYTWRVAMETLRMTPPVFCSFRRALKDIEYGGYLIPKGWQIVWAAGMTHMEETIFSDPSKFEPSRFEKQPVAPPYSFVAFGGGPRICPGYEFAKIETLVMIHYLVTRFTWKLSCENDSFSREPMPVFYQELPVQIAPKKQNGSN